MTIGPADIVYIDTHIHTCIGPTDTVYIYTPVLAKYRNINQSG